MTNPTNSGSEELKVEDRWKEEELKIECWLTSLGLDKLKHNVEVDKALRLTYDEIKSLSAETCYEYSILLQQYSFFLQKQVNELASKLYWAKHNLDIVIGKLCSQYGNNYTKYEERKQMIISDNSYAAVLNKMILECQVRIHSLDFLSSKVATIAKSLTDYGYSKRVKYENQ